MAKKRVRSLHCPTCHKPALRDEPEFPFCSERCRLVDLGKWASGGHVISTPINQGDQFGEADYTVSQGRVAQAEPARKHDDNFRKRS